MNESSMLRFIVVLALSTTFTSANPAYTDVARLSSFGFVDQLGQNPEAPLIEDSAGMLYGTTPFGGAHGFGTVFKMMRTGGSYEVLKHFSQEEGIGFFGFYPTCGLTLVSNTMLYGVWGAGGQFDGGTLFRLNTDGSNFSVLHHFGAGTDGVSPVGELIWADDGYLYGHTSSGGSNSAGVVFRLQPDGSAYEVVHHYDAVNGWPQSALAEGRGGWLYGVTAFGGNEGAGAVYKLRRDGSEFSVIHHFSWNDNGGVNPACRLLEASNGLLYGTTPYGGPAFAGTVFRLSPNGSGFVTLKAFTGGVDGGQPGFGLIEGDGGYLYGVCSSGGTYGFGTVFKLSWAGAGFSTLKSFNGVVGDPAYLSAPLLKGSDSRLYGIARSGGLGSWHACCGGAAFRISQNGSGYSLIRQFSPSGFDGREAFGRLAVSGDGFIYGTTLHGGIEDRGTVFKVGKDGSSYTLLRSFRASGDGMYPEHGVIDGGDGFLYGTTYNGGSPFRGTVFRISKNGGSYATLRVFQTSGGDGQIPRGGLVAATDGFLYGTTSSGGASGAGTLFKLARNGSGYTNLKHFTGGSGGASPAGSLIQASDGALYGATIRGGAEGVGVVFKINPNGTGFEVLASLNGFPYDQPGEFNPPNPGALLEAVDGRLYGVTHQGGTGSGSIYRLNKDGSGYAVLHVFRDSLPADGIRPVDGLTESDGGWLYGSTREGGAFGMGTLYRIRSNGDNYEILHHFSGVNGDGNAPRAGLTKDVDGSLYGSVSGGGLYGQGMTYLVGSPVLFSSQPQGTTNTVGTPALFNATAEGVPTPRFQWYRDGLALVGENAASLAIAVVDDGDAASYELVASNIFGAVTSEAAVLTVNHFPVGVGQTVALDEDHSADVVLTGTDVDGNDLSYVLLDLPAHGTLTGAPPDLAYAPDPDYFGTDAFTFVVDDGLAEADPATVDLVIHPINDPPVAVSQSIATEEDTALPITLVATDVEGDSVGYQLSSPPSHGTLSGEAPNVIYRPSSNYFGPDDFTFKANDGQADSAEATVSIEVLPVNDVPVARIAVSPLFTLGDDTNWLVLAADASGAAVTLDGSGSSDVEGDPLQFVWFLRPETNILATGMVATVTVPPGQHVLRLEVNDGSDMGAAEASVEIITAAQAVEGLAALVDSQVDHPKPLLAKLSASFASLERANPNAAINVLHAFQNQLNAPGSSLDPALRDELVQIAQQMIDVLLADLDRPAVTIAQVPIPPERKTRLQFAGDPNQAYQVEASTNMVDWVIIGTATEVTPGEFEFEGAAEGDGCRFFRVRIH